MQNVCNAIAPSKKNQPSANSLHISPIKRNTQKQMYSYYVFRRDKQWIIIVLCI